MYDIRSARLVHAKPRTIEGVIRKMVVRDTDWEKCIVLTFYSQCLEGTMMITPVP